MIAYLLDTDTLSLYQRGHTAIASRINCASIRTVGITVVTIEEQLAGRYSVLRQARNDTDLEAAYDRIIETVSSCNEFAVVRFSIAGIARYRALLAARINIGKMDLRIAAIALESAATVVTRNTRDFSRVPGLTVEDWSV